MKLGFSISHLFFCGMMKLRIHIWSIIMEIYRDEELLYDDIAVLYVFNPVSTSGKKEFAVSCCFDNELFEDLKEMTIIFSQTLEDAMTFHIASDLVVEKDYDRIWLAHEDGREADVEGIYIALQIHDDSDYYHIITNAPDMLVFAFLAQIYITAIACPAMEQKAMGAPMLKFRDHAWDKINKTKYRGHGFQDQEEGFLSSSGKTDIQGKASEKGNPAGLLPEELLYSGLAAVECSSMKEYGDFLAWLMNNGYHPDKTVDPRYWDSLCRYLVCVPYTKRVRSQHRQKEGIDCVFSAAAVMETVNAGNSTQ